MSVLQIQNGVAIYATWTTIASLVNLTIVLQYDAKVSSTDAATISLSILTVVVAAWYVQIKQIYILLYFTVIEDQNMDIMLFLFHYLRFVLENFVLDKHVRFILTIYPVVIWALTGVFTENYNVADPTRTNIFVGKEKGCLALP